MTLPVGTISMSQVNVELGRSATATISLNEAAVRGLAGVPSGAIGMNNLQGKSNVFAFTISSDQGAANLRTLAVAAGWNETSAVQATVNSGVTLGAGFTVSGSFPNGVALTNNGTISGQGGSGGSGGTTTGGFAGGAGGTGLTVSTAVTITNNGTIAGGGGGGGGGSYRNQALVNCNMGDDFCSMRAGGGGGGGGAGAGPGGGGGSSARISSSRPMTVISGGTGGTGTTIGGGGGSGGMVLGTYCGSCQITAAAGGAGGGYATTGSNGGASTAAGGAGAAGGLAVSGNSNITWAAFGSRIGGIA
jgi:hypothetical protein